MVITNFTAAENTSMQTWMVREN